MVAGFLDVARARRWRWLGSGLAAVLLTAPVAPVALPGRAVAAPKACPGAVQQARAASLAAASCRGRVEVLSGRSETGQVFANPDGSSTLESSLVPARVHRSDGSWANVDTRV